jgi:hypothetical protein
MSTGELTAAPLAGRDPKPPIAPPQLHDLACVLHLHSTYSDGTASVDEIVDSARAAGVDVVLLTDHDTIAAREDGWEGWHDDVLLLVGVEVSPRGGHYLAFDVGETPSKEGGEPCIPAAVETAGGFGFAAHPFSEGSRMSKRLGRPHGWPHAERPGLTGIELWSLTTDAAEAWRHPLDAIRYLRDPEGHLDGPPAHHLEIWDELCRTRRVAAIGGLDAHQHGFRVRGRMVSPMRNERYFRLLNTYALCERPPSRDHRADAAQVYSAMREGRCYLGVDAIAPARGFRFWAESGDEAVAMGSERPAGSWALRASVPADAEIVLLRDGAVVARDQGTGLELPVAEAGVYRIEAHRPFRGRNRPWIYSNPIYLR